MSSVRALPEIVRVTLRQLTGRRRTLWLLLVAALPIVLAILFRAANRGEIAPFTRSVYDGITITILMPLVAILFGTGAFGAEIDDGTIVYLLAKPIPRAMVVAAKAFSVVAISVLLTGASILIAGLIGLVPIGPDGVKATEAQLLGVVVGSVCYSLLFMTVSLYTRRALVIGIGYMLVWEGALSSLLPGIANLSIRQYTLGAAASIYKLPGQEARLSSDTALILSAVLIVGSIAIAIWKLGRFELPGGSD